MIYTIGKTELYKKNFRDMSSLMKQGRSKDFEGGWVWEDYEGAQNYIDECCPEGLYSVYGVLADWDKGTVDKNEECEDGRYLKKNSLIVQFDKLLEGDSLFDADEECEHAIMAQPRGGVKCVRCNGWFCF